METTYMLRVPGTFKPVIADVSDLPLIINSSEEPLRPNTWTIHRMNVPEEVRKQGYGTKLLQLILDDADAEGQTLMLTPFQTGRKGLTQSQLVKWYQRHGFEWVEGDELKVRMIRYPQPKSEEDDAALC